MSSNELTQKAKEVIRDDRLELLRQNADQQNTYCFFASMYEVAFHIHGDKLPPRAKEAEETWLSFGTGDVKGGVLPEEMFEVLLKISDMLGVQIEKIYANPTVLPHFLNDKVRDAEDANSKNVDDDQGKTTYLSHVESRTRLNRGEQRVNRAQENGWKTVIVVTFSKVPNDTIRNNLESVPIEQVSGVVLDLNYPYIQVLVKEEESGRE